MHTFFDRASLWLRCMGWARRGRTTTTSTSSAARSAARALPACCPRRALERDTTQWARHTSCTWTTGRGWRIHGPRSYQGSHPLYVYICMFVLQYVHTLVFMRSLVFAGCMRAIPICWRRCMRTGERPLFRSLTISYFCPIVLFVHTLRTCIHTYITYIAWRPHTSGCRTSRPST